MRGLPGRPSLVDPPLHDAWRWHRPPTRCHVSLRTSAKTCFQSANAVLRASSVRRSHMFSRFPSTVLKVCQLDNKIPSSSTSKKKTAPVAPLTSYQEVASHTGFSQGSFVPSLHLPATLTGPRKQWAHRLMFHLSVVQVWKSPRPTPCCQQHSPPASSGQFQRQWQTQCFAIPSTSRRHSQLQTLSRTFDDVLVRKDVPLLDDADPLFALPPFSFLIFPRS